MFENLLNNLPEPIFCTDSNGKCIYANKAFCILTDLLLEACIDQPASDFFNVSIAIFVRQLERVKNGSNNHVQLNIIDKNKHEIPVTLSINLENMPYDGENTFSVRVIQYKSKDVPELAERLTNSGILEIEKKYKTLYNLTFEGIIIHDNGILVDCNPAFARIMGYDLDEVIGENIIELCVLPEYHKAIIDAMKLELVAPYEVKSKTKDGTILHNEVESRSIVVGDKTLRVTAIRDITAKKQIEIQLKESEARYKLLSSISFEGIFIHDNGIFLDGNQALSKMTGFDLKELIGENIITKVVLPEYFARVEQAIINEEPGPYEIQIKKKDGTIQNVEIEAGMVNYHGRWVRITAARNIDDRKIAESNLRNSKEELDNFFSKSADGFFIMNLKQHLVWNRNLDNKHLVEEIIQNIALTKVNQALADQFGVSMNDLMQFNLFEFFNWKNQKQETIIHKLFDDGHLHVEAEEKRPDNSCIWIEGNYVVLYDHDSKIRGLCGVRRDITDRKISEESTRRQNEELIKTNEELDNFVYRVSHDLKAPIASAKGLVNLTRMETEQERIEICLDLVEQSMNKLDSFILDILDYSRNSRTEIATEEIDFEELIEETKSHLLFYKEECVVKIEHNIKSSAKFNSDNRRLKFIFNNMISNAIKFADGSKNASFLRITIDVDKEFGSICFSDNGLGIKTKHLDYIFDMFYRASEGGSGSGLGLYIVKEAVEKLFGEITVSSTPGKGTTFEIKLPNMNG